MKRFSCFLLCVFSLQLHGQIIDQFQDMNFRNPTWFGDTLQFIHNVAGMLQLNASEAGSSMIYTPHSLRDTTVIALHFEMGFAPSNSNQLEIFLFLDTPVIEVANGYKINIGETGSDDDLELYIVRDGTEILIAEGRNGHFGSDPAGADLFCTFEGSNLRIRTETDGNIFSSFTIEDIEPIHAAGYFGIGCRYTSTRKDKFYFDNFYSGPPIPDTTPPSINDIKIGDAILTLKLSEDIDTSVLKLKDFSVNPDIGIPSALGWDQENFQLILEFTQSFLDNKPYVLRIPEIQDRAGNSIIATEYPFERIVTKPIEPGDLILTEYLPDPTPGQGLPELEFIELYNNTPHSIHLEGVEIIVNDRNTILTDYVLRSAEYLIITKLTNRDAWESYGNVLGTIDFPIIKNSEGSIILKNKSGATLHHVEYNESITNDPSKGKGGWTFEIINPDLYCEGQSNWAISENPNGGTPGHENSIIDRTYSGKPLSLHGLWANDTAIYFNLSHNLYSITANEALTLFNSQEFTLDTIVFNSPSQKSGFIPFHLEEDVLYEVQLNPALASCSLQEDDRTYIFGLGKIPERGDVIINEVLFNPRGDGSDYIELVNKSSEILNLQDLLIINHTNDNTSDVINYPFSFLPGDYVCLTQIPTTVLEQYDAAQPELLYKASLPGLSNSQGNVTLYKYGISTENLIDQMDYDENMHHEFISNPNGVALERVSFEADPLKPESWYSASAQSNFGTPTQKNSQQTVTNIEKGIFRLSDRVLNTDNPDKDNSIIIQYVLKEPGYVVNADVFTLSGQKVRNLYHQEILGTNGQLFWDGRGADNSNMRSGVYIIYIEAFHPNGKVIIKKLSCVLARNS